MGEASAPEPGGGYEEVTQAVPASEIDAAAIAQAVKDAEEDLADADNDVARDKARERLEQLTTLKAALGH